MKAAKPLHKNRRRRSGSLLTPGAPALYAALPAKTPGISLLFIILPQKHVRTCFRASRVKAAYDTAETFFSEQAAILPLHTGTRYAVVAADCNAENMLRLAR